MRSIRVHSSDPHPQGPVSYIVLSFVTYERVTIDFTALLPVAVPAPPNLTFSQESMYELLEGKDLSLPIDDGMVTLRPRGEELIVITQVDGNPIPSEQALWLSEFALAWNILSRPAPRGL